MWSTEIFPPFNCNLSYKFQFKSDYEVTTTSPDCDISEFFENSEEKNN